MNSRKGRPFNCSGYHPRSVVTAGVDHSIIPLLSIRATTIEGVLKDDTQVALRLLLLRDTDGNSDKAAGFPRAMHENLAVKKNTFLA